MPEFGYQPVNQYLPPRPRRDGCNAAPSPAAHARRDARSRQTSRRAALARPRAVALTDRARDAADVFDHRLHRAVRRRLRRCGSWSGSACCSAVPGTHEVARLDPPSSTPCTPRSTIRASLGADRGGFAAGEQRACSASVGHLGQPLRAWRAFSQWRSSWLSREGVASLLTYLPMLGSWPRSGAAPVDDAGRAGSALGGAALARAQRRHRLLHRPHLCEPETGPRMAQPLRRARSICCWPLLAARCGWWAGTSRRLAAASAQPPPHAARPCSC